MIGRAKTWILMLILCALGLYSYFWLVAAYNAKNYFDRLGVALGKLQGIPVSYITKLSGFPFSINITLANLQIDNLKISNGKQKAVLSPMFSYNVVTNNISVSCKEGMQIVNEINSQVGNDLLQGHPLVINNYYRGDPELSFALSRSELWKLIMSKGGWFLPRFKEIKFNCSYLEKLSHDKTLMQKTVSPLYLRLKGDENDKSMQRLTMSYEFDNRNAASKTVGSGLPDARSSNGLKTGPLHAVGTGLVTDPFHADDIDLVTGSLRPGDTGLVTGPFHEDNIELVTGPLRTGDVDLVSGSLRTGDMDLVRLALDMKIPSSQGVFKSRDDQYLVQVANLTFNDAGEQYSIDGSGKISFANLASALSGPKTIHSIFAWKDSVIGDIDLKIENYENLITRFIPKYLANDAGAVKIYSEIASLLKEAGHVEGKNLSISLRNSKEGNATVASIGNMNAESFIARVAMLAQERFMAEISRRMQEAMKEPSRQDLPNQLLANQSV